MKRIVNRLILILPAILLQLLWYLFLITIMKNYITLFTEILSILSVILVIYIVSKRDESSYKILWLLIILVFPIFGAWIYLRCGNKRASTKLSRKIEQSSKGLKILETSDFLINELKKDNMRFAQTLEYVSTEASFPIVYNEQAKYFKLGEEMYEDMLIELKNAKKFVFLEYFIIEEGIFLNSIIDILEQKANDGVDVRIIYDDLGSITTYSYKNSKKLNDKGIKCIAFNPLIFIKASLNNRNHRKMLIIDNEVVYSGGINIADEYINIKEKYGHWKDTGFKLTGDAVNNYTFMFIQFWNAFSLKKLDTSILKSQFVTQKQRDGYVLSYYDSPSNLESISNNLYMELLSQATNYIWFYTPYLVIGDSLVESFIRAAKRGVDVRIMVPGIPDKKIVYRITRSYYKNLMDAGVKIYEYEPGFLHAKACIMDDVVGTIGTVNLDYRSLFLHYECNSVFYKADILKELKRDYEETIKKCKLVEKKDINNKIIHRIINAILRIFAPLC